MKLKSRGSLYVGPSAYGRGVFTSLKIKKGKVIAEYPFLIVPYIGKIIDYAFNIETTHNEAALVLGYGSLMNHSDHPNVKFRQDKERDCFVFTAGRDLRAGEELFISYGETWFSSRGRELS